MKQSAELLLQSVPESIDLEQLSVRLLEIEGIDYVGSIHVWALSADDLVGSIHVDCLQTRNFDDLSAEIKKLFALHGVQNVTIEPHFVQQPLDVDVETKLHLSREHAGEFRCE